jgi:hypothetical protein
MSTQSRDAYESSTKGAWAYGVGAFGGVLLVMLGLFEFLQGLSAALKDDVFVATSDYVYSVNLSGWGWIHMAIGGAAVVVGLCVLYGQTWARATGILVAVLSAVANFAFLPYYPWWSLLVIAIDVLVIWALSSLIVNT